MTEVCAVAAMTGSAENAHPQSMTMRALAFLHGGWSRNWHQGSVHWAVAIRDVLNWNQNWSSLMLKLNINNEVGMYLFRL